MFIMFILFGDHPKSDEHDYIGLLFNVSFLYNAAIFYNVYNAYNVWASSQTL